MCYTNWEQNYEDSLDINGYVPSELKFEIIEKTASKKKFHTPLNNNKTHSIVSISLPLSVDHFTRILPRANSREIWSA
ncbi:hypothetical protein TCT1_25600 [Xenorhabdus sp. TCT-1]|uniref:Uncharacterized protein n=1 Tax=Xenorhabdus taiwanensis TaxID=3085177 RepID=A0ABM8K228_9GAMM|nr:hypothetical protein TCT1_25600 [Xenorhabdus sp. TCT-1]